MAFIPDPVIIINLVLCVIIFFFGYAAYRKSNNVNPLLIGIAFGLFGLSHLNTLLGLTLFPEITFVLLRLCGYVLVAAALYMSYKSLC
ncbi:MAG: hypothetical protein ABR999_03135 [Methanoregula sp.]|jgi:hypothetical protein|uniref:hypothetical protein n=1 Tax=Methanoregula sp. TaxID=2052170 RepID=UPI003D1123FC